MGLQLSQKKVVKPLLQQIFNDFRMLKDGEWTPDADSCEASMDNLRELAIELGVKLDNPDGR